MSLEQRLRDLADGVGSRLQEAVATDLRSLIDQVLAEAAGERDLAVAEARDQAASEALEQARQEHVTTLDRLRSEHEEALRAASDAAATERLSVVADQHSSLADRDAAITERDAAIAERDSAFAERDTVIAERDAVVAERDAARAEAKLAAEHGPDPAALADARAEERQADLLCAEHLLDLVRRLDRAATLSQVLDGLAEYGASEAGRTALFVVEGQRLRLWRVVGLDGAAPPPEPFSIAADESGVLSDVIQSGLPKATPGGTDERPWAPSLTALGLGAGRVGLALPVAVGGRVVAVLCADEGFEGRSTPSAWPELLEVAARHAGRCLEALTAARAASLWRAKAAAPVPAGGRTATWTAAEQPAEVDEPAARRHARLLIAEIRLYNESAVLEGRRAGDLASRLGVEIDRARRLYDARIPASVAFRDRVFDDELVRTLADGDPGLLGPAA